MKSRVFIYTFKISSIVLLTMVLTNTAKAQDADNEFWSSEFTVPGAFSADFPYVYDLIESPNGVFVTGHFNTIDGVPANSIAYWSNGTWNSLGEGLTNEDGSIAEGLSLHLDSDNLYVVGEFENAGGVHASNLAIWNLDSEEWTSLPGTFNDRINTVVTVGSNIYVGGDFSFIDDSPFSHIAVWDGESWNSFQGGVNGSVYVLKRNDGHLYVGGSFSLADGVAANNMAIWTGSEWFDFGGGSNGEIYDIHFSGDSVFVGGNFSQLGGDNFNNLGIWSNGIWNSFPVQPSNTVFDIEGSASELVIAGYFSQVGILETNGLAIWNGNSWDVPNNELTGFEAIYGVASFDDNWIAGGFFRSIEDSSVNHIASLNSNFEWEKFGLNTGFKGASGTVRTFQQDGTDYYVGGSFKGIGTSSISRLAKWNGTNWESLGESPSSTIHDILVDEDFVYVAGSFTSIGGIDANRIARWNKNTEQWSALGEGVNQTIYTLLKVGNKIYVGGFFTEVDGSPTNRIAVWDGNSWDNLGEGVNGAVRDMIEYEGKLFIGGSFNEAGLVIANHIAAWNGESWENMGDGLDDSVYSLAATDSSLIIGGDFENSADGTASHIVEWISATDTWASLGSGLNGRVNSLYIHNDRLYAGGTFTQEDFKVILVGSKIATLNGISIWDDKLGGWEPLGDGVARSSGYTASVYEVTAVDDELFVSGAFDLAGGKASSGIAVWDISKTPVSNEEEFVQKNRFSLEQNYPNPFNPSTNIRFELTEAGLVTLNVFNILGQKVATLANGKLASGVHTLTFNANNLPSGVYVYQLTTSLQSISRKMLLIK